MEVLGGRPSSGGYDEAQRLCDRLVVDRQVMRESARTLADTELAEDSVDTP